MMKVRYMVFVGFITMLTITFIAGCNGPLPDPPSVTGAEKLTAREAWNIISAVQETLDVDGVPAYIYANFSHDLPIAAGEVPIWSAGFYSEEDRSVLEIHYFAWDTGTDKSKPELWNSYGDISLTVYDLVSNWNIDSPEACDVAAQNGAGETEWMRLQAADLEALNKDTLVFINPEFIPESAKAFWVIMDKNNNYYYIDANSGEYLGSCTEDYLRSIKD